eukprot:14312638-Alexandrium_andersonii.AAC.1
MVGLEAIRARRMDSTLSFGCPVSNLPAHRRVAGDEPTKMTILMHTGGLDGTITRVEQDPTGAVPIKLTRGSTANTHEGQRASGLLGAIVQLKAKLPIRVVDHLKGLLRE